MEKVFERLLLSTTKTVPVLCTYKFQITNLVSNSATEYSQNNRKLK